MEVANNMFVEKNGHPNPRGSVVVLGLWLWVGNVMLCEHQLSLPLSPSLHPSLALSLSLFLCVCVWVFVPVSASLPACLPLHRQKASCHHAYTLKDFRRFTGGYSMSLSRFYEAA